MNKESDYTTFRSRRGTSNIDLTVISDQLLRTVVDWEISEQESCSDHRIIRYVIGQGKVNRTELDFQEVKYIVQKDKKKTEIPGKRASISRKDALQGKKGRRDRRLG